MEITLLDHGNEHLLNHIAVDVFDHEITPANLSAFLDCPRHIMVLAVADGQVIGMASAVEYFHPDKRPQLWINEVAVTPTQRNRGVGRQLTQALVDIGRARGCICAWIGTERRNMAACRCFASVGDSDGPRDFVMYEWDLKRGCAT